MKNWKKNPKTLTMKKKAKLLMTKMISKKPINSSWKMKIEMKISFLPEAKKSRKSVINRRPCDNIIIVPPNALNVYIYSYFNYLTFIFYEN